MATMQDVLDKLEFLFERYSLERRASTQPYLLKVVQEKLPHYNYDPEDVVVRETLMEHVGSLPVMATALYPFIDDSDVDLGKSLIMLAIHDIGELETGDIMTFTKTADARNPEMSAALKLLDPMYHEPYKDAEAKSSKTAKFAKSIDKITPDIVDYLTPADITIWRMKHFTHTEPQDIVALIKKHKRPYMEWNPFLTEFHDFLMDKLAAKLSQQA